MSFSSGNNSSSISGSTDVALSNPASSEVLGYNSGLQKWQNRNLDASYLRVDTAQGLSDSTKVAVRKNIGANRIVIDVKADFGAIMDGNFHQLSELYSTLAAAQAVYPQVTSLTQQVDWAAWQAALNAADAAGGATVFHPGGTAVIGGARLTTITASIEGVSSDSCMIKWNGAGGGLTLGDASGTATMTTQRVSMRHICLNGIGVSVAPLLDIGFIVGAVFEEVNVINTADNGVGIRLVRTQNSVFTKVAATHGGTNWLLDYEANGNTFVGCYSNNGAKYMLEYADSYNSADQSGVGPGHNAWYGCFFENNTSTTIAGVHFLTGILNSFTDCRFTQNSIAAANFAHILYETGAIATPHDTKLTNSRFAGDPTTFVLLQKNNASDPISFTHCTYTGYGTSAVFNTTTTVDITGNLPTLTLHSQGHGYIQHNGLYAAYATADQTITGSQTLTDSALFCQLSTNSTYLLEGWINYRSAVEVQVALTAPSDAVGSVAYDFAGNSDASTNSLVTPRYLAGVPSGMAVGCSIRGTVVSTTRGRLTLQLAQHVSDASTLILKTGSWLKLTKLD